VTGKVGQNAHGWEYPMNTTVVVGVRVTKEAGLSFFGIDEVNAALRDGKKVSAIEPEGALFQQIKDRDNNVCHTLSGFTIRVVIEE
jgi:hypothetical protein